MAKLTQCTTCHGGGYDPAEQTDDGQAPEACCPTCLGRAPQRARRGWDIFHAADGRTLLHVRWEFLARWLTRRAHGLDYARTGEGWL